MARNPVERSPSPMPRYRFVSVTTGKLMAHKEHDFMPASAELPSAELTSDRQRLFLRYFTATLVDLVVLNLFDEYSDRVYVSSFTVSLFAALLLQILLKLTIAAEHYVAAFFKARPGGFMKFMRWFGAWVVLFGSKFVILEALDFAFGRSESTRLN